MACYGNFSTFTNQLCRLLIVMYFIYFQYCEQRSVKVVIRYHGT